MNYTLINRLLFSIIFFIICGSSYPAVAQEQNHYDETTINELKAMIVKLRDQEKSIIEIIKVLEEREQGLSSQLNTTKTPQDRNFIRDQLIRNRELKEKFNESLTSMQHYINDIENKTELLNKKPPAVN